MDFINRTQNTNMLIRVLLKSNFFIITTANIDAITVTTSTTTTTPISGK